MPFIDLILFAVIAAFLVFRLRSVLGRRDGHEHENPYDRFGGSAAPTDPQSDDNIINLPDRGPDRGTDDGRFGAEDDPAVQTAADGQNHVAEPETAAARGVADIRRADASFDPEEFLVGARVAFDMVLGAYATGDRATLKGLLSPDVFNDFDHAITDRERHNQTVEDTLVGINTSDIVEAWLDNRVAFVTVKFVSEQVNATRDEDGTVIDGNPNAVMTATDFWTFSRDTKSRDPNWALVATASAE